MNIFKETKKQSYAYAGIIAFLFWLTINLATLFIAKIIGLLLILNFLVFWVLTFGVVIFVQTPIHKSLFLKAMSKVPINDKKTFGQLDVNDRIWVVDNENVNRRFNYVIIDRFDINDETIGFNVVKEDDDFESDSNFYLKIVSKSFGKVTTNFSGRNHFTNKTVYDTYVHSRLLAKQKNMQGIDYDDAIEDAIKLIKESFEKVKK